ncbi:hypothetical protein [Fundidesulfovibrio agrisoli]|uniref:hypothetical protein n=1 Tax=Fundidesulfovibrio agrisoli TaxID=2922717 RepID=UPI001FADFD28|nr:hypothetical protein [Fundidesulfovibrio agrisoli]
MSYDGPTTFGLTQAHLLAEQNGVDPYRPAPYLDDSQWWGNSAVRPAQTQWTPPAYQNFQYSAYQAPGGDPAYQAYGVQAPVYAGLEGGDYDRYENALRSSGEIAAKTAYDNTRRNLVDSYSNRGLYGSSQFTRQMDQQADNTYLNSLVNNAAQATAKRYDLQQQDQQFASTQQMQAWNALMNENQAANQERYNVWQNRMGENQYMNNLAYQDNAAANAYNYRSSEDQRDWTDAQAQRQIDFGNMLAQSRQDWDTQGMYWDARQNDAAWNRIYGTWSQVDPDVEHWEKKMLKNAANQSSGSGLGSSLGSVLGGIGGGIIGGLATGGAGIGLGASLGSSLGGGVGGLVESGNPGSLLRAVGGNMGTLGSLAQNLF